MICHRRGAIHGGCHAALVIALLGIQETRIDGSPSYVELETCL
jgi:hypothetical protein